MVRHACRDLMDDLSDTFYGLIKDYSGTRKKGDLKVWRTLSTQLGSKSQPYERAGALAFVVDYCLKMSETPLPDVAKDIKESGRDRPVAQELVKSSTALQRVNDMLLLVFKTDLASYGPVHCQMFKYYWDCLSALSVISQAAASLVTVTENVDIRPSLESLDSEMSSISLCVLRCWCLVRSHAGPAGGLAAIFTAECTTLLRNLKTAADQSAMELSLLKFCQLLVVFTCRHSYGTLQGMVESAALTVDQDEFVHWLQRCRNVADVQSENLQSEDAIKQCKYLETFRGLVERYASDHELLQKDLFVSLDSKLKSAASAVLKPYGGSLTTLYDTLWDSDITHVWDRDMKTLKQTGMLIFGENALRHRLFRAAPSVFAILFLLSNATDNGKPRIGLLASANCKILNQLQQWPELGGHAGGREAVDAPSGTEVEKIGHGEEEGGDLEIRKAVAQINTMHLGEDG